VDLRHAVSRPGVTPLSVILRSQATGSRSIAHHRELAELSREDFPLQTALDCDWVHFEGRNIAELTHMIGQLRQHGFAGRVSLEAEKPRAGLAALLTHADVLMFSRPWAEAAGFSEAPTLLASLRADGSGLDATWLATCTWGAAGAWLTDTQGRQYHAPSHLTGPVVDSVGAGDVFNAGLIDALLQGQSAADALHAAVRLAGRKVCQYGYTGL
jgi:ketohexokinase